jgi:hypothetical protein
MVSSIGLCGCRGSDLRARQELNEQCNTIIAHL